jgi:hypothetical protein
MEYRSTISPVVRLPNSATRPPLAMIRSRSHSTRRINSRRPTPLPRSVSITVPIKAPGIMTVTAFISLRILYPRECKTLSNSRVAYCSVRNVFKLQGSAKWISIRPVVNPLLKEQYPILAVVYCYLLLLIVVMILSPLACPIIRLRRSPFR